MGYITADPGVLTRELWPQHVAVANIADGYDLVNGNGEPTSAMEDWQLVPTSFEEVCEWAYIIRDTSAGEWSRGYLLLYKQPGETAYPDVLYPVTLRLQGFIKTCNLAPLGSWNGCVGTTISDDESSQSIMFRLQETAVRATQHLSLHSGGFDEPWSHMQKGLRNIRQLVHNTLSRGSARHVEPIPDINEDIYLTRRVFSKVRAEVIISPD